MTKPQSAQDQAYFKKQEAAKLKLAQENQKKILKLQAEKNKAIQKKAYLDSIARQKFEAQSKKIFTPEKSIKAENFNDRVKPLQVGVNGFYVAENNPRFKMPTTMGFDLFGISVSTDSLVAKAETAAVTAAQKAVTNYLAPAAPVGAVSAAAPVAGATAAATANPLSSLLGPIDPQIKQMLLIGGGGLVGLILLTTLLKVALK
jgi:hypothetical protein